MAKKVTTVIEYRFDKSYGYVEYARTQVSSMIPHYEHLCKVENQGAEVRTRKLV